MEKEALLSAKDDELEKKFQEHINRKKQDSISTPADLEPKHQKKSSLSSKRGSVLELDMNSKAMEAFKKAFQHKPMPKFAIYSRLDKNLL